MSENKLERQVNTMKTYLIILYISNFIWATAVIVIIAKLIST